MIDLELGLSWKANDGRDFVSIDPRLFELLRQIRADGQLKSAADSVSLSYRHAWGLVREWEGRFQAPLLQTRRGRGATLTEFADRLLAIHDDAETEFRSPLAKSSLKISAALSEQAGREQRRVQIGSSHDETIFRLREHLAAAHDDVQLDVIGSEGALRRYRSGEADIAGFHLPLGDLGRTVGAKLIGFLDDAMDSIHLVEQRNLGLISREDHSCRALSDILEHDLRFVNRQAGAATRMTFDALLQAEGITTTAIKGYGNEEYTHTAVAALVASGNADVTFGSDVAARRFSLNFVPMVQERFYIVVRRDLPSQIRQHVTEFVDELEFEPRDKLRNDELHPSIAVLKRVHRAGFWKRR